MTKQIQVYTVVATTAGRSIPAVLVAMDAQEADAYYRAMLADLKRLHPEAIETHAMTSKVPHVTRSSGLMVPDPDNRSGWRVVGGVTLRSHPVEVPEDGPSQAEIDRATCVMLGVPVRGRVGAAEEA